MERLTIFHEQVRLTEVAHQSWQCCTGLCFYLQTLMADNDGVVDGPGSHSPEAVRMATCLHLLLQAFIGLFSWYAGHVSLLLVCQHCVSSHGMPVLSLFFWYASPVCPLLVCRTGVSSLGMPTPCPVLVCQSCVSSLGMQDMCLFFWHASP